MFPKGYDVSETAPNSYAALVQHYHDTGRMEVWSGGSDKTVFGSPEANYAFRAWHDGCHLRGMHAFTPAGEQGAFEEMVSDVRSEYGHTPEADHMVNLLHEEIIGQLTYTQFHGGLFPVNQRAFAAAYLKDETAAVRADFSKGAHLFRDVYAWGRLRDVHHHSSGDSVSEGIAREVSASFRKYSDDENRDDHGRWTSGGGTGGVEGDISGDAGRLSVDAITQRREAFTAAYGPNVSAAANKLAADWYTMRPKSHLDAFLSGNLEAGPEKSAWSAIQEDTQSRLSVEVSGDHVDLYRGIPGRDVADTVAQAKARGADFAVIPIHDAKNATHQAVCATGQRELAENYAASRWERHGGDPAEAHSGVVLHMRVPKSDVVFLDRP